MRGKLVVIEGSDGSGKATQLGLLKNFLESEHKPAHTIDFPRYADSFYGEMAAQFLRGDFGDLRSVNPYLISVIYALDRAQAKKEMDTWLADGKIVIANRYAPSNMAHQAGRLPKDKRKAFIDWNMELEYIVNKIPKEDIVIFLYVPYTISMQLMANKDRAERSYIYGMKKDMVEKNEQYLKNAEEVYVWLSKQFPHWVTVHCVDENGKLRLRGDIHEEVKRILTEKKII